ncbi:MAG: ABC transporter permease [Desulfobacteraceae bacterium]|jgi:lipopolysaccharide transport system permease protein|nr:ABC transporter permease [Desulfobacteraceae bacterium]
MSVPKELSVIGLIMASIASIRSHRYLLKEFVIRDIKGRFIGSMGGNLWVIINPLATIITYWFIFSIVLRVTVSQAESGTDNFTIYFLTGFFPWFMFAESLSRSAVSMVENSQLITKVVFPVELLPASVVFSSFIINGIGMVCFLLSLIAFGYCHFIWIGMLYLIVAQIIFTWGISNLLAALCVFIRDIKELLVIILMVWFYFTPIVYPVSLLPKTFQKLMVINPMWDFINLYRQVLLQQQMDLPLAVGIGIMSLFTYAIGTWFFMRSKSAFGDVL